MRHYPPGPEYGPFGAESRLLRSSAYLDLLSDDIALYAIPGAMLNAFAESIEALSKANGILAKFHQIRRKDIEAGSNPSIQESLVALQSA